MAPKKLKRRAKTPKPPSPLRNVLADNFRAILISRYGPCPQWKWAELSGITQGTLGRALNGSVGVSIDTVYDIAARLGIEPTLLLTKGYFQQGFSKSA